MKVTVYELSSLFGDDLIHVTESVYLKKYIDKMGLARRIMNVEVPEKVHPSDDLEGHVYVLIDGKRYHLDDVLGTDGYGYPVIHYHDDKLACERYLRLKILD